MLPSRMLPAAFGGIIAVFAIGGPCLCAPKTITVAADGSGDFRTVQAAVAAAPDDSAEGAVIHIKPGTYQGPIVVPRSKTNITFVGDDAKTTILTYDKNVKDPIPPGIDKFNPGVQVQADNFRAERLTIQNTSGDHGQALAMRIDGDRDVLQNCRLLGWQDTLMVNNGRQYFRDCYIEGRVDFIYGSGTAVFDRCEIHSKNGGHVTAASTPQDHPYGFVFLNCSLTGDPNPWIDPSGAPANKGNTPPQADLGRPWRPYASVTYIDCTLGGHIKAEGWNNWGNVDNEKTARYAEYNSTGPGANPSHRVPWARQLTRDEADRITVQRVLGGTDGWNPAAMTGTTSAIETEHKVRIVLAGDSTMTDDAGWGRGFKELLKPGVECINLARGGRSSKSFRDEGSWDKVLALKPDYVLIQFGHNDRPGHGPQRETDPKTTYRQNMTRYVDEARAAGIAPILVTPLTRREFGKDGKIHSTLAPYAETVREIAKEKNVPLIDLQSLSIDYFDRLGPTGWQTLAPVKGKGYDGTHLNRKGSEAIGQIVVQALRSAVPALAPDCDTPPSGV